MRIRAEYSVSPDLRFLSNLEMMRLIERSLRRASLPYALTEGFNPHIKLSLGTVLPVGVWGTREYFDLDLNEDMKPEEFMYRINQVLPEGVRVNEAQVIPEKAASLMKIINSASYTFALNEPEEKIVRLKEEILKAESLKIKSRGKKKNVEKDLKAGIYKAEVKYEKGQSYITFFVSVGEPVNVRYDELNDLLLRYGISEEKITDICRNGNYIKEGEFFYTPLEKVI
ncbi:TIGR03936 family radical SAM-associated protein [Thermosyntropha sp.]|uniref:TIGR03936 family radical SAM-associated protein n=1 Tax=Thermosyntropha sp. TaxID=2740820 RepID=UPI0025E8884B|nr:TIGR03936 family radical SAM-associated protein [Thermosyntropha sp.]MBO8158715.1 DUF2344 domain-containing protein [Thermosyntropha sp.]